MRKECKLVKEMESSSGIKAVLFDYGGVIADEGFKTAVPVLAKENGLDPGELMKTAFGLVYGLGFTSGKSREDAFWAALRLETGIAGSDSELTEMVLSRFTLRPWMIEIAAGLAARGMTVGILSDQTHWLDELDARDGFFRHFDHVFNSYHLGTTKKENEIFERVLKTLGRRPSETLFIDDHLSNIQRAASMGLHTIYYTERESFERDLKRYIP